MEKVIIGIVICVVGVVSGIAIGISIHGQIGILLDFFTSFLISMIGGSFIATGLLNR